RLDLAPERIDEDVEPVADAEDRDAELEVLRIRPRRAVFVDRGRTAREDHAHGRGLANALKRRVAGQDLRVDAELSHATGDELRDLRSEVDDDEGLVHGGCLLHALTPLGSWALPW